MDGKKKIFYGLSGEGLGHCSRVYSIVQAMPEYEFHIFTWGDAHAFFEKVNYPYLHKTAEMKFSRKANGHIDPFFTAIKFLDFYFLRLGKSIQNVCSLAKTHQPSLMITDFEPTIARAAKKSKLPLLSIDTQHKLSSCSSKGLPWFLRAYKMVAGWFTKFYIPNPKKELVSTFYFRIAEVTSDKTQLNNIFLKQELMDDEDIRDDGFALMYYKHSSCKEMVKCLQELGVLVIVYGASGENFGPNFVHKEIDHIQFLKDLKHCRYVFCAAGNQLLGEAAALGKPMLVVPEPNQQEQDINGWYLQKCNFGMCYQPHEINSDIVCNFIETMSPREPVLANGLNSAMQFIRSEINT